MSNNKFVCENEINEPTKRYTIHNAYWLSRLAHSSTCTLEHTQRMPRTLRWHLSDVVFPSKDILNPEEIRNDIDETNVISRFDKCKLDTSHQRNILAKLSFHQHKCINCIGHLLCYIQYRLNRWVACCCWVCIYMFDMLGTENNISKKRTLNQSFFMFVYRKVILKTRHNIV